MRIGLGHLEVSVVRRIRYGWICGSGPSLVPPYESLGPRAIDRALISHLFPWYFL
jgi:hypothetical protein